MINNIKVWFTKNNFTQRIRVIISKSWERLVRSLLLPIAWLWSCISYPILSYLSYSGSFTNLDEFSMPWFLVKHAEEARELLLKIKTKDNCNGMPVIKCTRAILDHCQSNCDNEISEMISTILRLTLSDEDLEEPDDAKPIDCSTLLPYIKRLFAYGKSFYNDYKAYNSRWRDLSHIKWKLITKDGVKLNFTQVKKLITISKFFHDKKDQILFDIKISSLL